MNEVFFIGEEDIKEKKKKEKEELGVSWMGEDTKQNLGFRNLQLLDRIGSHRLWIKWKTSSRRRNFLSHCSRSFVCILWCKLEKEKAKKKKIPNNHTNTIPPSKISTNIPLQVDRRKPSRHLHRRLTNELGNARNLLRRVYPSHARSRLGWNWSLVGRTSRFDHDWNHVSPLGKLDTSLGSGNDGVEGFCGVCDLLCCL